MLTSSQITAPAGSSDRTGRRTDHLARGLARGPISKPIHDPAGERSNALPAIVSVAPPLGQLGVSGFGRGASFIRSQRGVICQDFRASQHLNVSVSNFQVPTCWHEGGSLWRKVEPRTRQKNPRPVEQVM